MKEIGGYFELELEDRGGFIHDAGILLNTGRNALELILRHLPCSSKVYIPNYTCEVVLEPFEKLGIQYSFYPVDSQLEISDDLILGENEYVLYTNYFGVKDSYVRYLVNRYPGQVIVDNAQALFMEPTEMCFYSPRKFVGIPDGGIAYLNDTVDIMVFEQDYSFERCSHLLKRIDLNASAGYADFKYNSSLLRGQPIKQMSNLTKALLRSIDYENIKKLRRENYIALHSILGSTNKLVLENVDSFACPMVYPYMTDDETLRNRLIENKVFVATYWPNVSEWCDPESMEFKLSKTIIPLPVDQRYGRNIINMVLSLIRCK